MTQFSDAYEAAEKAMEIPPVIRRGYENENPKDIGFWALVREDFQTHERKFFEQGFWALFVHRFGNWRMGQPKLIRAPSTVLYSVMFKHVPSAMTRISVKILLLVSRKLVRMMTCRSLRRAPILGQGPALPGLFMWGVTLKSGPMRLSLPMSLMAQQSWEIRRRSMRWRL